MDYYLINDLERLSGIKAHTIRIWEKRFGIISPNRTDTNIRQYDDSQLKKLLNIASLISVGFRISKIAALSPEELKAEILALKSPFQTTSKNEFYINEFIISMLDFNEARFDELFETIIKNYGIEVSILEIIYPFLYKTGVFWSVDEAIPAQEHFASTIIKRKFFSLIDKLPKTAKEHKKFILFLPEHEWHEIGLLFAEYLIRANGFETISLGQNVPVANIEYVVRKTKPDYLLTFLISNDHREEIERIEKLLGSQFKQTLCLLNGPAAKLKPYKNTKNLKVLHSPNDILKFF